MKNYSTQEKVKSELGLLTRKKRRDRSEEEKVRLLQLKLYDKAKREPSYGFYILYDKIFLGHVLEVAYKKARSNNGNPGIDGVSFTDIEKSGVSKFLAELKESLRTRSYRPKAVMEAWIDKQGGGKRKLGIPTIRDRVAQTACKLVIEPIFEADFEDCSYGYRPKRSTKGAITAVKGYLKEGRTEIYDADLSKYFDTIPHDKLMTTIKLRISDPRVLELIGLWLKVPRVGKDGKFKGGKKERKGTPQGGVISPLLSNIYLHLLDRIIVSREGSFAKAGIRLVRYADDFVLMARGIPDGAINRLEELLSRMGLGINKKKTSLLNARKEPFDFVGFTIRFDRSIFGKGRFWHISPKKAGRKKIRSKIDARLKGIGHFKPEHVVEELNPIIRGWINSFTVEGVCQMQRPLGSWTPTSEAV